MLAVSLVPEPAPPTIRRPDNLEAGTVSWVTVLSAGAIGFFHSASAWLLPLSGSRRTIVTAADAERVLSRMPAKKNVSIRAPPIYSSPARVRLPNTPRPSFPEESTALTVYTAASVVKSTEYSVAARKSELIRWVFADG